MKKQSHLYLVIALFFLAIGGTGCSLNNMNGADGPASGKEDLLAARRILAESLSSDESGVILSLNDALTSISENGFTTATYKGDHSGFGSETGYNHTYHNKTGIHVITFKRHVQDALFSKTVTDSLRYRYRASNGENIKFPQQHSNQIVSIYYDGRREGQITTLHKKSHFVRQDTFMIRGINTGLLEINGVHHGSGSIEVVPAKGPLFKRNYELEINLLNINATPNALNNNTDFWQNVSGTLSWQLKISHNGDSRKMGGTIKMSGAGIAMLIFRGNAQKYQVNLNSGDIKNPDIEFEGRVTVVDLTEQSVTLFNGRTLYLTSDTEIEQEAYASLEAVNEAMNNGITIRAEGEGGVQSGRFIVTEIEFEREDNDQDDDGNKIEFDDVVSSVDVTGGVFTLFGKVTVAINNETTIEAGGDYLNLQEVADALANGLQVSAEGEAITNNEAGIADLTATDVEFEQIEPNNNDGEED